MSNFYHFNARTNAGEEVSLVKFKGKYCLIINVASKCGFTNQYEGLQKLYEKYQNLEVLAFPCNQFGAQEPGDNTQIKNFCEMNYSTTFPLFDKIEVNGANTHPLFTWLKKELPGLLGTGKIKWNFTKFLIDMDGKPLKRFAPKDKPKAIESYLSELETLREKR